MDEQTDKLIDLQISTIHHIFAISNALKTDIYVDRRSDPSKNLESISKDRKNVLLKRQNTPEVVNSLQNQLTDGYGTSIRKKRASFG